MAQAQSVGSILLVHRVHVFLPLRLKCATRRRSLVLGNIHRVQIQSNFLSSAEHQRISASRVVSQCVLFLTIGIASTQCWTKIPHTVLNIPNNGPSHTAETVHKATNAVQRDHLIWRWIPHRIGVLSAWGPKDGLKRDSNLIHLDSTRCQDIRIIVNQALHFTIPV